MPFFGRLHTAFAGRGGNEYREQVYYDVEVKRFPMALRFVNVHKQPKGLCAAPKEMMRPGTWALVFSALSTAASEQERERAQGVCAH